jgi:hypothetical protein
MLENQEQTDRERRATKFRCVLAGCDRCFGSKSSQQTRKNHETSRLEFDGGHVDRRNMANYYNMDATIYSLLTYTDLNNLLIKFDALVE